MRVRFRGLMVSCFVACLLAAAPAPAAAPLIEESSFVETHGFFTNCGDFTIYADGEGTTRTTTFFDRDGQPIRVLFEGRYRGTLTNSVTGASITDDPSIASITYDLVAGTQTNVGTFFNITVPGVGLVYFEAGRIVFDGFGPPVFIAGLQHPPSETDSILCAALR